MSFGNPNQPFGNPNQPNVNSQHPFGNPNHSRPYAHPEGLLLHPGHPNYPGGPFHPGQYPHPEHPHSFDTPGYGQSIMPGLGFPGTGYQEAVYVYPLLAALVDCQLAWSASDSPGTVPKVAAIPSVRILADAANQDLPALLNQIKNSETEDDETQDSLYTGLMNDLLKAMELVRSSYYLKEIGKSNDDNHSMAVTARDMYTYCVSCIIVNLFKLIALQAEGSGNESVTAVDLINYFITGRLTKNTRAYPNPETPPFGDTTRPESSGARSKYEPLCDEAIKDIFGHEGDPRAEYTDLVSIALTNVPEATQMDHCVNGVLSELKELWDAAAPSDMTYEPGATLPSAMIDKLDATTHLVLVDKLGDLLQFSVNLARLADPVFSLQNYIDLQLPPGRLCGRPSDALRSRISRVSFTLEDIAELVKSRADRGKEWSRDEASTVARRTKKVVADIISLLPIIRQYTIIPLSYNRQPRLELSDILARNILKLRNHYPNLGATENHDTESKASDLDIK